jgi:luciferase-type oxidoreductase
MEQKTQGKFNRGYRNMFQENKLTLGVFFPIEAFEGASPSMENQVQLAQRAEELGFASLWFRDVPLLDPNFGDIGQIYDPWVYLGYSTAYTKTISLSTGSIILPLRSPVDLAKQASSVDQLSGGRLVLGVATGDRPIEFPAYNVPFEQRDKIFRHSIEYMRTLWSEEMPVIENPLGRMYGAADLVPKPVSKDGIPMLITGRARQTIDWIAKNGDGWLFYPQPVEKQKLVVDEWRNQTKEYGFKPFAQSLYIDLSENPSEHPKPIHLGYRLGRNYLIQHLNGLKEIGVNHVALNLKYGQRDAKDVLEEVGQHLVPHFPPLQK